MITLSENSKCVYASLGSTGNIYLNNIYQKIREGDQESTLLAYFFQKTKKQFLNNGLQNVLIRAFHILEFSWHIRY